MRVRFTKMQGAGNHFVVLDETRGRLDLSPQQYRWLADREHPLLDDLRLLHLERLPFSAGEVPPFSLHFRTAADRDGWQEECLHALGPFFQQIITPTYDTLNQ